MPTEYHPSEQTRSDSELLRFAQKVLLLAGLIGIGYLCFLLTPLISVLFFSGFLTVLFSRALDTMRRCRIPDWLGILIIYAALFLFFVIAFFAVVPIFVRQISLLFSHVMLTMGSLESVYRSGGIDSLGLPSWMVSYMNSLDIDTILGFARSHLSSLSQAITNSAGQLASSSFDVVTSVSGGVLHGLMILVFTFFMSMERASIRRLAYDILPQKTTAYLLSREKRIGDILTAWLRGQLLLATSIFLLTLAGLLALKLFGIHVEWIFTLALIAGLMEFIPYIGPLLALLPALAIAAGMGFVPVVVIFVLYIAIQQAENNILVPLVMSKSLDISPFLILAVMAIGASLFGLVGILLAIPFAALLKMATVDWIATRKQTIESSPRTRHKHPTP